MDSFALIAIFAQLPRLGHGALGVSLVAHLAPEMLKSKWRRALVCAAHHYLVHDSRT